MSFGNAQICKKHIFLSILAKNFFPHRSPETHLQLFDASGELAQGFHKSKRPDAEDSFRSSAGEVLSEK